MLLLWIELVSWKFFLLSVLIITSCRGKGGATGLPPKSIGWYITDVIFGFGVMIAEGDFCTGKGNCFKASACNEDIGYFDYSSTWMCCGWAPEWPLRMTVLCWAKLDPKCGDGGGCVDFVSGLIKGPTSSNPFCLKWLTVCRQVGIST